MSNTLADHTLATDQIAALMKKFNMWWFIIASTLILLTTYSIKILHIPFAKAYIDWITSLIPSIPLWVEKSSFPEQTSIYMAFAWTALPINCFLLVKSITEARVERAVCGVIIEGKVNKKNLLIQFLILPTVILEILIIINFSIDDGINCRKMCVNTSPFALLVFGSFIFMMINTSIYGFCIIALSLIKISQFILIKKPINSNTKNYHKEYTNQSITSFSTNENIDPQHKTPNNKFKSTD